MTTTDGASGMGGHGEQRVVLVTGTSSAKGIGLATSRALVARGHVVYATVRHPREAAELAPAGGPGRIETRELDLLDREPMGPLLDEIVATETLFTSLAVEAAPFGIRVTNFQAGPVMTELKREWGHRVPPGGDPRPTISDELYAWVGAAGPTPQQPDEAAAALADLVESDEPPLATQSSDAARAYAAAALRDPSRSTELRRLLTTIENVGARKEGR